MRRLIVVGLLAACGPGNRVDEPDAAIAPPVPPVGVWEPAPGDHRGQTALAADANGAVWWAYTEHTLVHELSHDDVVAHLWLTQTAATGELLMAPRLIDSAPRDYPLIAVTDRSIVVVAASSSTMPLWLFNHNGMPLELAPHEIVVTQPNEYIQDAALVARADGSLKVVSALYNSTVEASVVDVDASGSAGTTTRVGTAEMATQSNPVTGWPTTVSAAGRSDGSLVLAWDRAYDQCFGPKPAFTMETTLAPAPDPIVTVGDRPERGEWQPALASAGDAVYIVWTTDVYNAESQIAIARYPSVGTELATFGEPGGRAGQPTIALAAPDRGAVAWAAYHTGDVAVASFQDIGGTLVVGAPHLLPHVFDRPATLVGMVHVGDERYVVAWLEGNTTFGNRLYATQLDLSQDARQRPAPRVAAPTDAHAPRVSPRTTFGLVPCTH